MRSFDGSCRASSTAHQETSLGTQSRIDTSPQPGDTFHTLFEGDRIDLIAYRYLGRPDPRTAPKGRFSKGSFW